MKKINFSLEKTVAKEFFEDERIQKALSLISETLTDHQKKIYALKKGETNQLKFYDSLIQEVSQNRGGNLFYKYIGSGFGNGPFVELADGSVKYDFITGIGVHYFGHSNRDLILASVVGALENTPMQGHLQQNYSSTVLIKLILEQANKYKAGLSHVFLSSSGAMANENALKIAFQKKSPASRILTFEKCFSGRTLALSFVTDKAAFRQGLPKTLDVDYLPFFDEKNPEESTQKCLDTMKKHFKRFPKQHACLIFEPILGEGGSWAGNNKFFTSVINLAKENGLSIICDEVQTFGRTEELFAFQYYGLNELVDIITIGKMSQVCATIFREDHKPGTGLISQTFTSSSPIINASIEVINKMTTENFLGPNGKINKIGNYFRKRLSEISTKIPTKLTGPFGVGAMVAITVFDGDSKKSLDFTHRLYDAGVLSFTAGESPTRVRFLIPVGATELKHIDEVSDIISNLLTEMN